MLWCLCYGLEVWSVSPHTKHITYRTDGSSLGWLGRDLMILAPICFYEQADIEKNKRNAQAILLLTN